jgi:hypothetical protein
MGKVDGRFVMLLDEENVLMDKIATVAETCTGSKNEGALV